MKLESAGPSAGNMIVTTDQRRIVWNIGWYIVGKHRTSLKPGFHITVTTP